MLQEVVKQKNNARLIFCRALHLSIQSPVHPSTRLRVTGSRLNANWKYPKLLLDRNLLTYWPSDRNVLVTVAHYWVVELRVLRVELRKILSERASKRGLRGSGGTGSRCTFGFGAKRRFLRNNGARRFVSRRNVAALRAVAFFACPAPSHAHFHARSDHGEVFFPVNRSKKIRAASRRPWGNARQRKKKLINNFGKVLFSFNKRF